MAEPAAKPQSEAVDIEAVDIEADVDLAIEACGGDVRAALRATIVANAFLDAEVDRLTALTSAGFVRGKVRRKNTAAGGEPKSTD